MVENIKEYRKEIIRIISENENENFLDIAKLKNYIEKEKIDLKSINGDGYDILINVIKAFQQYRIEENHYSFSIIDYIIEQCKYETLNYTIYNGDHYSVPLFLTISKKYFKISDLLIERGADINYITKDSNNNDVNIIQYIHYLKNNITHESFLQQIRWKKYVIDDTIFNHIFNKGFDTEKNITKTIYDLLSFYNYRNLETIFKKYIFKNSFILSLLSTYKNKIPVSSKNLKNIIEKERKKLKIDSSIYSETKKFECQPVKILMDYDGDSDDVIFDKIIKNEILEEAIKKNNTIVINKIVNLISFDINKIDLKKILINQCYINTSFNNTDSLKFFFKCLKSKNVDFNLTIMKDVILNASKNYHLIRTKENTVNYFLELLLNSVISSIEKNSNSLIKNKYSKYIMAILNMAIKLNNQVLIKKIFENRLLKNQFDINSKDENNDYCIITAFSTYMERNRTRNTVDDVDKRINTDTFAYLLSQGADIKKQEKQSHNLFSLFNFSIISKTYSILKCILKQQLFINSIDYYNDLNKPYDPKKAISLNTFFKFISLSGFTNDEAFTKDIFSNQKFSEILNQHVNENILRDGDSSKYSQILKAICENDMETVKTNINYFNENRINISMIDYVTEGFTPLILSYLLNRRDIFDYLFNYCNINRNDGYGNTLLHYSIIMEDTEMVKRLFQHGFKVKKNKFNEFIKLITKHGNKDILITVLNHCRGIINNKETNYNQSDDIDISDIRGVYFDYDIDEALNQIQFLIIESTQFSIEDKIDLMKYLIAIDVDINYAENEGDLLQTTLYCAFKLTDHENSISLIKFLLENGVDIEKSFENEETFLIEAIFIGNVPLVKYLIERGVNVNCRVEFYSPLSSAIEENSLPIAKILIENGADVNENIPDSTGETKSLLMSCIEMEQIEIAKLLMKHHAQITYHDHNDNISLIEMLENKELELATYIRQNNVEITTPEKIINLISSNRLDLLKILNKHQFLKVNEKDDFGNIPLFYALKQGKDKIVKFLIRCGSDLNVVNKCGETIDSINKKYNYTYNRSSYNKFKRLKISK